MREIKFRAWDKEDKRMITDTQEFIPLVVTNKGVLKLSPLHEENLYSIMPIERFEIMQYTGLKDKNGVEIYEGDIVKCVSELFSNFGKYPTGKYATEYYEICSRNGDCSYCFGTRKLNRDYVSKDILKSVAEKYYEVIGNIYENPELMKGDEL